MAAGVVKEITYGTGDVEVLNGSDYTVPLGIEDVHEQLALVIDDSGGRVTATQEVSVGTLHVAAVTVVVDGMTGGVVHLDVAVCIAHEDRIDGSDVVGVVEGVGSRLVTVFLAVGGVHRNVVVGNRGADFEPFLGLVFGSHASRQTVVVGVFDDTFVAEVAYRTVEVEAFGTAGDREVVFLTETVAVSFLGPVIGSDVVRAVVVAEGGGRVELAVGADHLLACGEGIELVAGTESGIEVRVGLEVCAHCGNIFLVVEVTVAESLVSHLSVHGGALYGAVTVNLARVATPAGVKGDAGIALLTTLGGDENHTVGTAGTVKSGGGGVLENGHGLDIHSVESGDIAIERHTVNYIKRSGRTVDGTDTADTHFRSGTGLAVGLKHLYTGNITGKRCNSVGNEASLNLVGFHH